MRKILLTLCLFFATAPAFGQTIALIPIGTTRQFTETQLIFIGKGLYAEIDLAKGQAAYDACMLTSTNPTAVIGGCQQARKTAETSDAQDRFQLMMKEMLAGVTDPPAKDAILRKYKMAFVPPVTP